MHKTNTWQGKKMYISLCLKEPLCILADKNHTHLQMTQIVSPTRAPSWCFPSLSSPLQDRSNSPSSWKLYGYLPGISYDMINFYHKLQLFCILKTLSQLDLLSVISDCTKGIVQSLAHSSFHEYLLDCIKKVFLLAFAFLSIRENQKL